MTPVSCIGKGLVLLVLTALGACGTSESEGRRFEGMANHVSAIEIPLDGKPARARTAQEAGLRGAAAPLRVEVMTPYQLWDARDGGLPPAPVEDEIAGRLVRAAAPAVAHAAVESVKARATEALRPAFPQPRTTIQLGAYSSAESARAAWGRLQRGEGGKMLANMTPVYETVQVGGRSLTRLKVPADRSTAAAICDAAKVNDPWCARSAA